MVQFIAPTFSTPRLYSPGGLTGYEAHTLHMLSIVWLLLVLMHCAVVVLVWGAVQGVTSLLQPLVQGCRHYALAPL
jgi:hypothetical protein